MLAGKTAVPLVESVAVQRPPTLGAWRGGSTRRAEWTAREGQGVSDVSDKTRKDSQTLGASCLPAPPHPNRSRAGPTPSWWNVVLAENTHRCGQGREGHQGLIALNK